MTTEGWLSFGVTLSLFRSSPSLDNKLLVKSKFRDCKLSFSQLFTQLIQVRIEHTFWTELTHLHSVLDLDCKPWMIGGDFNHILHVTEQSVSFDYNNSTSLYQFKDTLLKLGMFDSRYQGPCFSWLNKHHALPITKKLDKVLLNYASLQSFPHTTSFFLAPMISDHSPCLIDLAFQLPKANIQPFKFPKLPY